MGNVDSRRRLVFHGLLLFLIGLLVGFAVPAFRNPRMGLSTHLVALINGGFLLALAGVWQHVKLAPKPRKATVWGLLYGSYANVVASAFAAAFGTNALTPIVGEGFSGHVAAEWIVTAMFVSTGFAMVGSIGALLWSVRK